MKRIFILFLCALLSTPAYAEISANHWAGSVIIGPDDNACDNARRGAIRYESVSDYHEYCDGTEWKKFVASSSIGDPSTPPAGTGYFVLSAGTWNGNLGGRAGADSLCLTDLTNNDWLNKTDAVSRGLLIAAKVKSFICTDNTVASCNNALPGTTYTFAASGFPTIGGATFTTNASGQGPGNTQNWVGTNYFGADARYWSNRGTVSASLWATAGQSGSGTVAVCGFYDGTSGNGNTGNANNTSQNRWHSTTAICTNLNNIICMVHP